MPFKGTLNDEVNEKLNDLIVLIYPYFKTEDNINQKFFNPLGIAFLSALLKERGLKVVKIDCTFRMFDEVIEQIVILRPKIIGFYTMVTFTKNINDLIEAIRPIFPESLYICGGPLATLFPKAFSRKFDIVFKGEMDATFTNFVRDYFEHGASKKYFILKRNLSKYSGIYVNKRYKFFETKVIHLSEKEFKTLPLPDREDFDHVKYQKFWQEKEGMKSTSIITTVGCPFNCDFCSKPIFGNYLRKRNINDIMKEIEHIKSLGYNHLWISDDCLTLDLKFLNEFCDRLIEKNFDIKWSCLSRADILDFKVFKKMKRAGCEKVYLGLESGNDEILKLMGKNLTVNMGRKAVALYKKALIQVAGFFIVGYPGETWETIDQTFDYALELNLDEVSFNVPYPLPGSDLFERISMIDFDKDWVVENEIKFVYDSVFEEEIINQKIENFYKEYEKKQLLNII